MRSLTLRRCRRQLHRHRFRHHLDRRRSRAILTLQIQAVPAPMHMDEGKVVVVEEGEVVELQVLLTLPEAKEQARFVEEQRLAAVAAAAAVEKEEEVVAVLAAPALPRNLILEHLQAPQVPRAPLQRSLRLRLRQCLPMRDLPILQGRILPPLDFCAWACSSRAGLQDA